MRGANIIVILLVVGLLIFGCTGPTPSAQPNGGGNNQSTGGSEGTSGSSGGTGTTGASGTTTGTGSTGTGGNEGTGGTGTSGSTGGSSGTGGTAGDDLTGKGYEALVAMGIPLQCDITVTNDGKTTNMMVYMKGSDEVRSEVDVEGAEACTRMVSIMKGKTFYTGCVDDEIMPNCKWLQMTIQDSGTTTTGTSQPPDYADVPPAQINCVPWVYDASKFSVSGTVCNLDDMMQGYQQGNYPND
jgi:hypothetical protein